MTKFLLSIHVLAAIITIGPVTVAASMFPAVTRRAQSSARASQSPGAQDSARADQAVAGPDLAVLRALSRICRVYAVVGVVVPVFGFATASSLGVLGDAWLIVSMVLTAAAAGVLALLVLPRQEGILAGLASSTRSVPDRKVSARLAMYTGMFNMLWAVVTVLMIVRPGSTTGA
ncbi:membrane protein [Acrocarpospora pleiomorpha]|uniref:Membrane protein n=1 Tax=Acrocarpospora pleiomorpha TaxID=90975 RepID=A0A5M3XAL5_9ACTN|nr:hypothetical protein [Acrocarpospora pleiomorpha]GES17239.1 membrane protein [Acrocarpospora pleiomorpha]